MAEETKSEHVVDAGCIDKITSKSLTPVTRLHLSKKALTDRALHLLRHNPRVSTVCTVIADDGVSLITRKNINTGEIFKDKLFGYEPVLRGHFSSFPGAIVSSFGIWVETLDIKTIDTEEFATSIIEETYKLAMNQQQFIPSGRQIRSLDPVFSAYMEKLFLDGNLKSGFEEDGMLVSYASDNAVKILILTESKDGSSVYRVLSRLEEKSANRLLVTSLNNIAMIAETENSARLAKEYEEYAKRQAESYKKLQDENTKRKEKTFYQSACSMNAIVKDVVVDEELVEFKYNPSPDSVSKKDDFLDTIEDDFDVDEEMFPTRTQPSIRAMLMDK